MLLKEEGEDSHLRLQLSFQFNLRQLQHAYLSISCVALLKFGCAGSWTASVSGGGRGTSRTALTQTRRLAREQRTGLALHGGWLTETMRQTRGPYPQPDGQWSPSLWRARMAAAACWPLLGTRCSVSALGRGCLSGCQLPRPLQPGGAYGDEVVTLGKALY